MFLRRNWRSGQPDNIGTEDCVGVYVGQPAVAGQSINGQWNDDSCDVQNRYLCSRAEGELSNINRIFSIKLSFFG